MEEEVRDSKTTDTVVSTRRQKEEEVEKDGKTTDTVVSTGRQKGKRW